MEVLGMVRMPRREERRAYLDKIPPKPAYQVLAVPAPEVLSFSGVVSAAVVSLAAEARAEVDSAGGKVG